MALISPAASIGLIILFIVLLISIAIWKGGYIVTVFSTKMFEARLARGRKQDEEQTATNETEG
ncbi:hypothetical protein PG997_012680 [Apiospora hydei]|uniref:Uncharacterized protein n=1 Tax=Apiospora hydei TaxID=1337664 RepID=A0ABR1V436_9PEZI